MIWLVQLVFDCRDPDVIATFWGRLLGYDSELVHQTPEEVARFRAEHPQFDGRGRIDDRELRRMPVYIQRVPEPKASRNRVRLEVTVPPDDIAPGEFADPEGNEYTVKVDRSAATRRLSSVVIDAGDPRGLAEFWSEATGYLLDPAHTSCSPPPPSGLTWAGAAFTHPAVPDCDLLHITGAGAPPGPALYDLVPALAFTQASSPKTAKNRIHIDLSSTDAIAERERLVELGATVLQWDGDHVLADPEGNEFCLGGRVRRRDGHT